MSWAEDNGFDAYDYDDFSGGYSDASNNGSFIFLPSVRNSSKQDLSSVVYDLVKRVRVLENEIDLIKLKEDV